MIKAIFFDIDGTLVSFRTHAMPASARAALMRLREKGVKLFIATGRNMDSIRFICQLPGDYEVYPGHMDSSTLERERMFNYYCRLTLRN